MSTISSAISYFKSLAEQHVDIAHTDDKPSFFRTDIEEFYTQIPAKMPTSKVAMIFFNYIVDFTRIDKINKQRQFMVCFLKFYKHNDFNGEEEALDLCEEVATEIVRKINADNFTDSFLAKGFDFKSVRMAPMKFANASGKYVGWQISFQLNNRIDICIDNSKWITPEP